MIILLRNKVAVFFILFAATILFSNCWSTNKARHNSRVENFEYQGYGDTIVSLIFGEILESPSNDDNNFQICSNARIMIDKDTVPYNVDSTGKFQLGFQEGIHSFVVFKKGYQPLTVNNFIAHSDRVSIIKIILAKGNQMQSYTIKASPN